MTDLGKIKDWMTSDVLSITENTSIIDADATMREHGIRRLPVTNKAGKLTGIVTKGDVREASPSDATTLSIWEINHLIAKLQVKDVMTKNVLTISPDAEVIDAAEIMLNKKVSGLPVVDSSNGLVGIITESDIFRMLVTNRLEISQSTT